MKRRPLWIDVGMPLVACALISIGLHFVWGADGFFLNLATEVIGILVTVWYVDRILTRHEASKWASLDERVADRLRVTLNAAVRSVGTPLGVSADDIGVMSGLEFDPLVCHRKIVAHASELLPPIVMERLPQLDATGWRNFANQVQLASKAVNSFHTTFRDRLSPQQLSDILDLEDALNSSLCSYLTFPDVLGIPPDQAPKGRYDTEESQRIWCKLTADEIARAMQFVRSLSNSVNGKASPTSERQLEWLRNKIAGKWRTGRAD